jgi:hypothetical protein
VRHEIRSLRDAPGSGWSVEEGWLETGPVLTEDAAERYLPPRPVDLLRIERAVREILVAVGEDPDRGG